jgi:hypothetical protein
VYDMALNGRPCQHRNIFKNGTDKINSEGVSGTEDWETKFIRNLPSNLSQSVRPNHIFFKLKHDHMFRPTKTIIRPPLQKFSK